MISGSLTTHGGPGKSVTGTFSHLMMAPNATTSGSGRSAPRCTIRWTTAEGMLVTAGGGTPHSSTETGSMTSGSLKTNSIAAAFTRADEE